MTLPLRRRRLASWSVILLVLTGRTVSGHDIPNERVDRSIQVVLSPGRLRVDYEVSLSELTLAQDLRNLLGQAPGADRTTLYDRYGRETAPLNARGFLVSVDGRDVELSAKGFALSVEEHPRYTFHLEAEIPPQGHLSLQDTNYIASQGTSRLAARGDGVMLPGYDGPEDVADVPIRPVWQLTDAEERRTKRVELDYETAALPKAVGPVPVVEQPQPRTTPTRPAASRARPPATGSNSLSRLLDRASGTSGLFLWLLSLGLGAAHAVQPGHGKTLVAAATLGERGSCLRGLALALVTTLTHFSSVLLIAALIGVMRTTRYTEIHLGLAGLAGFVIAALGLWRVGRHLAGYGEHEDGPDRASLGGRGVLSLGLAGGIVPCWDAVVLVLLADLAGRLALAVWLLTDLAWGWRLCW